MDTVVKKYVHQFSLFYVVGCLIGFPLLVFIDNTWNIHLHDFILFISLAAGIPFLTCDKFIKNEGRYFTTEEQQVFVKKSAKIATMISLIPTLLFAGSVLFIKLFAPPEMISHINAQHALNSMQTNYLSLNSAAIIAIMFCTAALYYLFIRFSVSSTLKSIRKRYEKKSN